MKRYCISIAFALLLTLEFVAISSRTNRAQTQQPPDLKATEQENNKEKTFKPTRELLLRAGVPFDPDILQDPAWRRKLAPKLSGLWQMHTPRRLGKRLSGLQLADVLYLPEKVELTADTVIIVNKLVFEGRDVLIKGNYNIAVYPIEDAGALGTTLEEAMLEQGLRPGNAQFINVSLNGSAASGNKRFVPQLIDDGTITIDTSGAGYREWLEKHNQKKPVVPAGFIKTSLSPQTTIDHSGNAGGPGNAGSIGNTGSNGSPDPASAGISGDCSSQTDGYSGFPGQSGGTGSAGTPGDPGYPGDPGSNITYSIPKTRGIYTF
ncbi:MAG TPA: collagen-like protein [Pyrinomonadaceae bacterium]|jgi:hypothetical protein